MSPFFDVDEQVFRVGGRINKAPISYGIRHPHLLPKKSHISLLMAQEKHRHAHLRTAAEVRKNYYYLWDRGKPVEQRMADLPEFRVTGGGGQLPYQIWARQWGKIRAKQEEKIGQRKLKD